MSRAVWFEETGERREIVGVCARCKERSGRYGEPVLSEYDACIVGPRGVAHSQSYTHPERTLCGRDATGESWWWRL